MNDANLIHEEEIQELYWAHYQDLCLLAMSKTQNLEVAQDIVQEFFINYWERRSQGVSAPENFMGYASRAIRNLSVDYFRRNATHEKRQAEMPVLREVVDPYEEDGESEIYYIRLKRVFELIEELPEGQRTILKLHALDKLTYAQIAEKQNVSINTVRTQLTRAYTKLRKSASGLMFLALLEHM